MLLFTTIQNQYYIGATSFMRKNNDVKIVILFSICGATSMYEKYSHTHPAIYSHVPTFPSLHRVMNIDVYNSVINQLYFKLLYQ